LPGKVAALPVGGSPIKYIGKLRTLSMPWREALQFQTRGGTVWPSFKVALGSSGSK
jgi:hypothetical protein